MRMNDVLRTEFFRLLASRQLARNNQRRNAKCLWTVTAHMEAVSNSEDYTRVSFER